jgi:hypothetical protein
MAKVEASQGFDILFSERELFKPTYPNSRCGKVKRAPTLSEYEDDDTDYYSRDDSHYEERDR